MPCDRKHRFRLLTFLRIVVTLLALLLLFIVYKPGDVSKLIVGIGLPAFVSAIVLYFLCILIGAWKWGVVIENAPFSTLLRAVTASCFYSILPSGQLGGELSKVMIVKSSYPEARNVIASVIFDKMTGVLGLLLIGILALCFSTQAMLVWQISLVAVLIIGCTFSLLAARSLAALSQRLVVRNATLQRLQHTFGHALHSVARFSRNPILLIQSIVLGVLSQGTVVLVYLVIAEALHISIPSADIITAVVFANLAALLPISVGGFGVREAGLTAILAGSHGVTGEQSLALSMTAMSIFLLAAVAGGAIELRRLFPRRRAI